VPLTVGQVEAVAFFRQVDPAQYRVSLRSKGGVNVGAVAQRFGGGGHKNAAGCTVTGSYAEARAQIEPLVLEAIGRAGPG
jgi:phosphoesterase RecJ-like protein